MLQFGTVLFVVGAEKLVHVSFFGSSPFLGRKSEDFQKIDLRRKDG